MCSINAFDKFHVACSDSVSSRGGIVLPYGSTTDVLMSVFDTLNFVGIWLQNIDTNYICRCNAYKEK